MVSHIKCELLSNFSAWSCRSSETAEQVLMLDRSAVFLRSLSIKPSVSISFSQSVPITTARGTEHTSRRVNPARCAPVVVGSPLCDPPPTFQCTGLLQSHQQTGPKPAQRARQRSDTALGRNAVSAGPQLNFGKNTRK